MGPKKGKKKDKKWVYSLSHQFGLEYLIFNFKSGIIYFSAPLLFKLWRIIMMPPKKRKKTKSKQEDYSEETDEEEKLEDLGIYPNDDDDDEYDEDDEDESWRDVG